MACGQGQPPGVTATCTCRTAPLCNPPHRRRLHHHPSLAFPPLITIRPSPPSADLEKHCRPDAILSTNTSTIDIELVGAKMAGGRQAAERLVGAHFFSPAHIVPLLEIVRTKHTSAQVGGGGGGAGPDTVKGAATGGGPPGATCCVPLPPTPCSSLRGQLAAPPPPLLPRCCWTRWRWPGASRRRLWWLATARGSRSTG